MVENLQIGEPGEAKARVMSTRGDNSIESSLL